MAPEREKLILIDGHSLLHRAFFALPPLTTAAGEHTNAVFGFATMLLRLIEDERPEYLAVAFDKGKPTIRLEAFAEYKAGRPPMAPELQSQVPLAKELVRALNLPLYEIEGYEADDVIGTLASQAEEKGLDVLIVTGDLDALQLVSPQVSVLVTRRGIKELERFGPEEVRARLGVDPAGVVDLKALTGDKSDNIPGVPGIGEKTAARLLAEYGSLDRLLDARETVAGKVGEALRAHAEQARLSRELARIDRRVPVSLEWEKARWTGPDRAALAALYRRLEFRRLLNDLEKERAPADPAAPGEAGARPAGSTPPERAVPVRIAADEDSLATLGAELGKAERIALLPVYQGALPHDAVWVGVALAWDERTAYVPLAHRGAPNAPADAFEGPLRAVVAGEAARVTHDLKALIELLAARGARLGGRVDDVMLAGYLLAPGQGGNDLEGLALKYKVDLPEPLSLEKGTPIAGLPPERVAPWAAGRCRAVAELCGRLFPLLDEAGLRGVYEEIELPLVPILAEMERRGVRVDTARLRGISEELARRARTLEEEIARLAGTPFNPNSPKQLAHVLFERLGLPAGAKTKSGPSTSAEVLEELADEHPIVGRILEYRQVQKLKGTYVDALPSLVHGRTGRVHTTFNQAVAATGRLSSASPNLQNIPVRTPEGQEIRKAFVPGEGFTFLKADYSQIELRVLAHMSEDEGLIEAFRRGADIHRQTAAELFGVAPGAVSAAQRSAAKAINFGIVYGISSFGLARGTGLSREAAQAFIDAYFARYPGVKRYMEETVALARRQGYVTTLRGRRRYLPEITSRRWSVRSFAERAAINSPIQGSAADIIKAAMVAVAAEIKANGIPCHLLLQVHDELLFEVPPGEVARLARVLKETMEGIVTLRVPLVVELSSGPTWMDQEPVPLAGGGG